MTAMETDLNLEVYPSPDGRHDKIWSLSWSPLPCNGAQHMLATCGDNALVWECHNSVWSKMVLNTERKGPLKACAWRLDGRVLAAGGCDSKITLWKYNEKSFECIIKIPVPNNEIIKSLSWSKRGLLLSSTCSGCISIIGSDKHENYNVKCRKPVPETAEVCCAEWHPDGLVFALGGYRKVKVCHAEFRSNEDATSNDIHENGDLITHDGDINSVSFWVDGSVMVAAGDDTLQFLGVKGSNETKTLLGKKCFEEGSIGYLIGSGSNRNEVGLSVQDTRRENNTAQYRLVT